MANIDESVFESVANLNFKSLGEMNVLNYMSSMQGYQRLMQQLGDDARGSQQRTSVIAENLMTRAARSIHEMDVDEGLGVSTALTRIDPGSQAAMAAKDGTLYAMLSQILANTAAK
jgi:hypothetical protein